MASSMTYFPKTAVSYSQSAHAKGTWSSGTTYSLDDQVIGSDGKFYVSGINSNTANDPTAALGTTDVAHNTAGTNNYIANGDLASAQVFTMSTTCAVQYVDIFWGTGFTGGAAVGTVTIVSGDIGTGAIGSGTILASGTATPGTVTAGSSTRFTMGSPITLTSGSTYTVTVAFTGGNTYGGYFDISSSPTSSGMTMGTLRFSSNGTSYNSTLGGYSALFTLRGVAGTAPWTTQYDPTAAITATGNSLYSLSGHSSKGTWSSSVTYAKDDLVTGSDGNLYAAGFGTNLNNDPTAGAGSTDVAHQSAGGVNTTQNSWTFQVTSTCVVQGVDLAVYSGSGTYAPTISGSGITTTSAPSTASGTRAILSAPVTLVPGVTYTINMNTGGTFVMQCSNTPSFSNITSMSNASGYYLTFTLRGTSGTAAPWYKVFSPNIGLTGVSTHLKGIWSSATTYAIDDMVIGSDGGTYVANLSQSNNDPTAGGTTTLAAQSAGGTNQGGTTDVTFQLTSGITANYIQINVAATWTGTLLLQQGGTTLASATVTAAPTGNYNANIGSVALASATSYKITFTTTSGGLTVASGGNTLTNISSISSTTGAIHVFALLGISGTAPWSAIAPPAALTGTVAPTAGQGVNGQVYLNTGTGDVYEKNSGTWALNPATVQANRQTASYTLVLTDAGQVVEMNVASANNLTVPPNSSVAFPVGTVIEVLQYGAGQTTFVAGSGVTINSYSGKLNLAGQYAGATLRKIATNEWSLVGSLA